MDINEQLLIDCAQLVKANSIEGNKKDNITVIYTPWSNLKKSKGMVGMAVVIVVVVVVMVVVLTANMEHAWMTTLQEVGQVGFKSEKTVKKVFIKTRENVIVNRLNKTKEERQVNLATERVDRDRQKRNEDRSIEKQKLQEQLAEERAKKEAAEVKSYKGVMKDTNMRSNSDLFGDYVNPNTGEVDVNSYEDDFM